MLTKIDKLRAGHAEIQGETIAKFELFEQGFNPYSRYLDVDKVDLILRKREGTKIYYREVQVKFGRLYRVGYKWEQELFDVTSWKFFKPDDFKDAGLNLFVAYVLSLPVPDLYKGDIFIFPAREFHNLINRSVHVNSKKGPQREVLFSRSLHDGKWYLRLKKRFTKSEFNVATVSVQQYWRNFNILK
ncbi:MAG: hypothetical protein HY583_01020 [Candidatus Omnitrophica bacterium]|nr:hypothetical protein [Candidatus Omnitrophota bacterium]